MAASKPEASEQKIEDSPELAHLRLRLKQEEAKTAALEAHPDTKDHDIPEARRRNARFIQELRQEIKRLEKKQ